MVKRTVQTRLGSQRGRRRLASCNRGSLCQRGTDVRAQCARHVPYCRSATALSASGVRLVLWSRTGFCRGGSSRRLRSLGLALSRQSVVCVTWTVRPPSCSQTVAAPVARPSVAAPAVGITCASWLAAAWRRAPWQPAAASDDSAARRSPLADAPPPHSLPNHPVDSPLPLRPRLRSQKW